MNPNIKGKKKRIYWRCKCDCGNESIVTTSDLTTNKTTQCYECAHYVSNFGKRKNYVGEKIGHLTVLEMIYPTREEKNTKTKARCKCDCGNEVIKNMDTLIAAKRKNSLASCGCAKQEIAINSCGKDITNQRFGRLLILEIIWKSELYSKNKVRCLCDCGNEVILNKNDVQSGHTLSCGCLQRERASEANKVDDTNYISDSGIRILHPTIKNSKNQQLWLCECFCGNTFEELPARIKNNHVQSCGCMNTSIKEKFITDFLIKNNIKFIPQYTYNDCKNTYVLRFDFALFNDNGSLNCLLEYDGKQHFEPINLFGGEEGYQLTVKRDNIKNNYCKENNIKLVRLPYYLTNDEIKEQILNTINP